MGHVLVADDDLDIRELVTFVLKRGGHEVAAVADGEAALTWSRDTPPDLFLLDIMMPRQNGIEVCRSLRSDPITADLPVILLTAKAQDADIERGFRAGADDYIVKPFSPRELLTRVNAAMGRVAQ